MKKLVLSLLLFTVLLAGCGKSNKPESGDEAVVSEKFQEVIKNDWTKEIKLDNGKKWKANPETLDGVKAMLKSIANSERKSMEDYRALAIKLNTAKNKLVKECTMEGPAHDNLHIFLKPLIEKIGYLSDTDDVAEASKVVNSIEKNLKAFSEYFE